MLKALHLQNFKSHQNTRLELGNLTLLCGQNGVGKSSFVQSILLLRQSYQKNRLQDGLDLNKPLCEIGTAQDALYQYAQENFIQFLLESDDGHGFCWRFAYDENNPQATFLNLLEATEKQSTYQKLAFFGNNFQYLSAARLAPQESYPKDDYAVARNRQLSIEKGRGELVAHFLDHYRDIRVQFPAMLNQNTSYSDLLSQTTAWEREISKNINVKILDTGRGYEVKYNFDVQQGLPTTDFRAENVGFGVTYALPLIVAILAAEKNTLLLIENPEAHLHPYGQAKLAELMALAAQSGIQLLVETHSDHLINGVLVACKKFETEQKGIDRHKVKIYYFDRDEEQHATVTTEVKILENGKIQQQPSGFFDQIEHDLEILLGF